MTDGLVAARGDANPDVLLDVAATWWTPDPKIVAKLPRGGKEPFGSCRLCGGWHKQNAVHLDFVGHADLTRALIEIDPYWQWEPVAWTADGLPLIARRGSQLVLWGRLTLLGKTLLCVGTSDDKNDADKELIGDLLRNGGMRFGIFGALWSKTDGWEHDDASTVQGGDGGGTNAQPTPSPASTAPLPKQPVSLPDKPLTDMKMSELIDLARQLGVTVNGSKSTIVYQLQPLVDAQSGTDPFDVITRETADPDDLDDATDVIKAARAGRVAPNEKPFSPVVAVREQLTGSERRRADSSNRADL